MNWLVTVDDNVEYTIDAATKEEAMALASRYFSRDHNSSEPNKGRVTDCKEVA